MHRTDSSSALLSTTDDSAFRTLGIAPNASIEDIRTAYRRRARETHPDRNGGAAADEFLAVQAAFERLAKSNDPASPAVAERASATARIDTITVCGVRVERAWDTVFSGFEYTVLDLTRRPFPLHRVGAPNAVIVHERELVQAPAKLRKLVPHTFIVLHGLLFPVTKPNARLLAMDLVHLDPASACPYALVARHRSWLLVRQHDGRLLAQNSRRGFSRVGGYGAFSDASGEVVPVGERVFPPFEAPLTF